MTEFKYDVAREALVNTILRFALVGHAAADMPKPRETAQDVIDGLAAVYAAVDLFARTLNPAAVLAPVQVPELSSAHHASPSPTPGEDDTRMNPGVVEAFPASKAGYVLVDVRRDFPFENAWVPISAADARDLVKQLQAAIVEAELSLAHSTQKDAPA